MASILVVEDDPSQQRLLEQLLSRAGHRVRLADSGAEGLRQHHEEPADLLILDIMVPGQDGLEVMRQLRALAVPTKILATSGGLHRDTSWLVPIAQQLGADRFMPKPFGLDDMLGAVREMLAA